MNSRSICALAILFGGAFVTVANGQDDTPAPPADSRVPVAAPPIHEDPAIMIKVFTLDNVTAAGAVNVLRQVFPEGKFFADERTNSVIAQGVAPELEKVEALLLQLDRPTAELPKESPAGETRDRPRLDEYLRGLRGQYSSQEKQARTVAESLAAEKDAEASQRLRERLKIVVTESFGLRQELQKAELELLRERIRAIEAQLQLREKLRDEIIKRRVEQLASGEPVSRTPPPASSDAKPRGGVNVMDGNFELMFNQLAWDQVLQIFGDAAGLAVQFEEHPQGTFSYRSPKRQTIEEALEALSAKLPAGFDLVRSEGQLVVRRRDEQPTANAVPAGKITRSAVPKSTSKPRRRFRIKSCGSANSCRGFRTRRQSPPGDNALL